MARWHQRRNPQQASLLQLLLYLDVISALALHQSVSVFSLSLSPPRTTVFICETCERKSPACNICGFESCVICQVGYFVIHTAILTQQIGFLLFTGNVCRQNNNIYRRLFALYGPMLIFRYTSNLFNEFYLFERRSKLTVNFLLHRLLDLC